MSRDKFLLVISLVKINTSLCYVTQGGGPGGGEGEEEVSPNVTKGEAMLLERRLVIPVKVNKLSGSVRRLSMTSPGRKFIKDSNK
jgi:hypothetical protein